MVAVNDVLHHISQQLRLYSDTDKLSAIDEFLTGCTFDFHLTITKDVEESELSHLERFGKGHTFYFRHFHYEHGKILTEQFYRYITGVSPSMDAYTSNLFKPNDRLYLFIHLQNISPKPATKVIEERDRRDVNLI